MENTELTQEEFNLYNPAYTGFLIYSLLREFDNMDRNGINPALIYLCLPLILNKGLSTKLPSSYKTSLIAWLVDNETLLINFSQRINSFFDITQNAMDFLFENKLLEVTPDNNIMFVKSKLAKSPAMFEKSNTMKRQLSASKLLGKWLAVSPDAATIYSVLGIRP